MAFVIVGSSVRQQVQCTLAKRYKTVEVAENGVGLTLGDNAVVQDCSENLKSPDLSDIITHMTPPQAIDVEHQVLECTEKESRASILENLCQTFLTKQQLIEIMKKCLLHADMETLVETGNAIFMNWGTAIGIESNPRDFLQLSLTAMRLQEKEKDTLGTEEPLMPLERMSFGLIEYTIEFFTCTNIHQVIILINELFCLLPLFIRQ